MKVIEKSISDIINDEIKSYALYSIYNRAIPNVIDGFKPTQRKLFYAMRNFYKSKGWIIVSSLAGAIREPEKGNYHHGNDAAAQTIINMAKDYPTSNQIPIFLKKGEFGSRLVPDGAAAPRYISVKYNSIMDYIFRLEDEPILPKNLDLENPEPEFYIPIIPMVLVNGTSGIATGFATKIYPRKVSDIINWIKNYLYDNDFELDTNLYPYFKDTNIGIGLDISTQTYIAGGKIVFYKDKSFKKKSEEPTKYVQIIDLPPKYSRESILKMLNRLKESKIIVRYKDLSKDSFLINIELVNTKEKTIDKFLDILDEKLNENFVLIEPILNENLEVEDLKIIEYIRDEKSSPEVKLLQYFVNVRLKFYEKRIEYVKNRLQNDINFLKKKLIFIKEIENFKGKNKDYILTELNKKYNNSFSKVDIDKLLNIPFYSITKDAILKTKAKIKELKNELNYFENITPKKLYLKELNKLSNILKG